MFFRDSCKNKWVSIETLAKFFRVSHTFIEWCFFNLCGGMGEGDSYGWHKIPEFLPFTRYTDRSPEMYCVEKKSMIYMNEEKCKNIY